MQNSVPNRPLKERFVDLWCTASHVVGHDEQAAHGADVKPEAAAVFDKLFTLYSEKWRSYHNMAHIESCLLYFNACSRHAADAMAIEMAVWFHDCIYTVGAKDNEALSRDFFMEQAAARLHREFVHKVCELIMDTCHTHVPKSDDGKLLSDVDLTSFSLPWEQYLADYRNVQQELGFASDDDNIEGKVGFLRWLNRHGAIYHSPHYAKYHEANAQTNIARHLKILTAERQV